MFVRGPFGNDTATVGVQLDGSLGRVVDATMTLNDASSQHDDVQMSLSITRHRADPLIMCTDPFSQSIKVEAGL